MTRARDISTSLGQIGVWWLYNQTTPSVDGSYNVTSISDDAAGLYTVNHSSLFVNTSETWIGGSAGEGSASGETFIVNFYTGSGPITTSVTPMVVIEGLVAVDVLNSAGRGGQLA